MITDLNKSSRMGSVTTMLLMAVLSCAALTDAHQVKVSVDSIDQKVPVNLQKNLLLYLSFDRDGGTRTVDVSGMDFHGKVEGAEFIESGKIGGAMSFDGDNDCLSIPDIKLSKFSFSAWVKIQSTGINNRRIFLLSDGKNYYGLQGNTGDSVGIYVADDVAVNEYDWHLSPEAWTHIVVTHDGLTFRIYKDGQLTETGEIETGGVTGTLYIGGTDQHRGGFWQGMIDEAAVFNRSLSESEVMQLYKSTFGKDTSGAIWPPGMMGGMGGMGMMGGMGRGMMGSMGGMGMGGMKGGFIRINDPNMTGGFGKGRIGGMGMGGLGGGGMGMGGMGRMGMGGMGGKEFGMGMMGMGGMGRISGRGMMGGMVMGGYGKSDPNIIRRLEEMLATAREYLYQKKYDKVMETLNPLLEKYPQNEGALKLKSEAEDTFLNDSELSYMIPDKIDPNQTEVEVKYIRPPDERIKYMILPKEKIIKSLQRNMQRAVDFYGPGALNMFYQSDKFKFAGLGKKDNKK